MDDLRRRKSDTLLHKVKDIAPIVLLILGVLSSYWKLQADVNTLKTEYQNVKVQSAKDYDSINRKLDELGKEFRKLHDDTKGNEKDIQFIRETLTELKQRFGGIR